MSGSELIIAHIQEYVGDPARTFHEVVSDPVHVDIHLVAPTPSRSYFTLVTNGMSDRPMSVPEGMEEYRHAELVLCLPAHWPLSEEALQDEANYWPLRALQLLARFPHTSNTWLGFGHTVDNGDPPEPFAPGTQLCAALLLMPILFREGFLHLKASEEKTIHFLSVVPIFREERDFTLKHGVDPLLDRFDVRGVTEIVDIKRKNVCQ